nr:amino acid adenylation domain-containing protein [Aliikangiella sp. G2MR2-5]
MFTCWVEQSPQSIAVSWMNKQFSYSELDRRSNRLADLLRARGITKSKMIGLYMDRSFDLMVALLATLKAGAAYVPIDPEQPAKRIESMIGQVDLALVITDLDTSGLSLGTLDILELCEEQVQAKLCQEVSEEIGPQVTLNSQDLAYAIFTSGSTGMPKAVAIDHGALANFILGISERLGKDIRKLLAVTTFSFDIAALELIAPLVNGGEVVLASRDQARDPSQISDLLKEHEVTCMQATPATWQMLFDSQWKGSKSLTALCGGEALSIQLAKNILPLCNTLWNCYGPTETTIWSMLKKVNLSEDSQVIPIGNELDGYHHFVIDLDGNPAPKGAVGELCITGRSLATGYMNNPELSRQMFVESNHCGEFGRYYRTGDLVRYTSKGNYEFLGRKDEQVKVRGFRVELGEIEYHINQFSGISACVVVAATDESEFKRLTAYLKLINSEASLEEKVKDSLKQHLSKLLPNYMIPGAFVIVDDWPKTASGKIDKKALRKVNSAVTSNEDYVAPLGDIEIKLAAIWSRLLDIELAQVSRDSDFFELGGHSLLVMKLISNIREVFSLSLPMREIFRSSSLRLQANLIEGSTCDLEFERAVERFGSCIVRLNQSYSERKIFCLPPGMGSAAAYRGLSDSLADDFELYALQPPEIFFEKDTPQTFSDLVGFYSDVIQSVQPTGGYSIIGYSLAGPIAFEVARELKNRGAQIEFLGIIDSPPIVARKVEERREWYIPIKKAFDFYSSQNSEFQFDFNWNDLVELSAKEGIDSVRQAYFCQELSIAGLDKNLFSRYLNYLLEIERKTASFVHSTSNSDMTLFRATSRIDKSSQLGWECISSGEIEVIDIEGEHHELMLHPVVSDLSDKLKRAIFKG